MNRAPRLGCALSCVGSVPQQRLRRAIRCRSDGARTIWASEGHGQPPVQPCGGRRVFVGGMMESVVLWYGLGRGVWGLARMVLSWCVLY